MELRHLRYFLAVAEEESFRAAAARLRVAQPALSRQIAALEGEVGVLLFHRLPRTRLTSAGQTFLTDCRRVLADIDSSVERIRRLGLRHRWELRVSFSEVGLPPGRIREIVGGFRERMPQAQLQLLPMGSTAQMDSLRSGRIDSAFLYLSEDRPEDIAHVEIDVHDVVIAMPKTHPLAGIDTLLPEQLRGERLICVTSSTNASFCRAVHAAVAAQGLDPGLIQETNSAATVLSLVSVGMGLGLVTSNTQARQTDGLHLAAIPAFGVRSHFALAWRQGDDTPVVASFVRHVAEVLGLELDAESASGIG